jgi:hypothetical protein
MSKIGIKASVVAVSLSLALTPMGFAQSTTPTKAPVSAQTTANTQPLPGAKIAAGEFAGLTAAQVAVFVAIAVGLGVLVSVTSSGDDTFTVTATTGTR